MIFEFDDDGHYEECKLNIFFLKFRFACSLPFEVLLKLHIKLWGSLLLSSRQARPCRGRRLRDGPIERLRWRLCSRELCQYTNSLRSFH